MTVEQDSPVDPVVLELYGTAIEMADRISSRRGSANSYFLTVASGLTAVAGLASSTGAVAVSVNCVISVAGLLLCVSWGLQLRSYRHLNAAKFEVIHRLEKHFPVAIFSDEWDILKKDRGKHWRKRYAELGFAELFIPALFACVFLFLLCGAV